VHVLEVARGLAARGHEVHAVVHRAEGVPDLETEGGVVWHRIDWRPPHPFFRFRAQGAVAAIAATNLALTYRAERRSARLLGEPSGAATAGSSDALQRAQEEARRLKELERENTELKKMLAESLLKNRVLEYVCEKKL